MKQILIILSVLGLVSCGSSRDSIIQGQQEARYEFSTNTNGSGPSIIIDFKKGESFYYPLMAIWLEDTEGNYIQTLYVARSVATGVFKYGIQEKGKWVEGPKRAPQTLPYWAHKRGVKASDGLYVPEPANPVPDAYTGATPTTGFILNSKADKELPEKFKVMLEINQNWDWNQYWTNSRYPDDQNYLMSAQPAVVYEVIADGVDDAMYTMKPVGHSHYSGKTGELFPDLTTLTTALTIADSIIVRIKR